MNNQSRFFISENALSDDPCAILTKDFGNKSIENYNLDNYYFTEGCKCPINNDFVLDNVNLRGRDGYGNVNKCEVNVDSELKLSPLTRNRAPNQLCPRWYQGVPNLDDGGLLPNILSRLQSADDTSDIRDCDRVSEKDFNRFVPLLPCYAMTVQDPVHIVMPGPRSGISSRDYCRDDRYLSHCGFVQEGRAWVKQDRLAKA